MSTTWTYPRFFERSQHFDRATTTLWPEFQNIVQKLHKYDALFKLAVRLQDERSY